MQSISGATNTQTMSLQDTLNLLTTQLRNQDPLQPTDDTQFVNQVQMLNQTQQVSQMSDTVKSLVGTVRIHEAASLIGKTVDLSGGTSGVVSAVSVQSGTPRIVVNGQDASLDDVTRIH